MRRQRDMRDKPVHYTFPVPAGSCRLVSDRDVHRRCLRHGHRQYESADRVRALHDRYVHERRPVVREFSGWYDLCRRRLQRDGSMRPMHVGFPVPAVNRLSHGHMRQRDVRLHEQRSRNHVPRRNVRRQRQLRDKPVHNGFPVPAGCRRLVSDRDVYRRRLRICRRRHEPTDVWDVHDRYVHERRPFLRELGDRHDVLQRRRHCLQRRGRVRPVRNFVELPGRRHRLRDPDMHQRHVRNAVRFERNRVQCGRRAL
jgi:hypothetical protein